MEQGGKALGRLLKAPRVEQQHADLMAKAGASGESGGRLRRR
jgi:hypothetical protein